MAPSWWDDARSRGREKLQGLRVAVYGSGGAPFHHAALAAHFGATPVILSAEQIREGSLAEVDAIVFPGGGARAMGGMLDPLGTDGAKAVREWVAQGGMYIGSCAGSFLPARVSESYWEAHPEARELHMVPASLANGSDSEWEGLSSPGVGRIRVRADDPGHWLVQSLPETFELVHYNGPMFSVDQEAREEEETVGVVAFAERTQHFTPSEAFLGGTEAEGGLFERCVAAGAYTAIVSAYGKGTVVLFGSHPEFGFDTLQLGWGRGSQLFLNALLEQAGKRDGVGRAEPSTDTRTDLPSLEEIARELDDAAMQLENLSRQDAARWLEAGTSPQFLGLSPEGLWTRGTQEGAQTARNVAVYLRQLQEAVDPAVLSSVSSWLDTDAPEGQDYGFVGLRQLASRIKETIQRGAENLDAEPVPLEHAYDQLDTHPYQLVVGSYLSAIGLIACAALSASIVGLAIAPDLPTPTGPTLETTKPTLKEVA